MTVVGVDDDEYGQRGAAAVVLREGVSTKLEREYIVHLLILKWQVPSLSLERLRMDLREHLAGYKMPTLLRVVGELPKSSSGKVVKRELKKLLFPGQGHPDIQFWKSRKEKF